MWTYCGHLLIGLGAFGILSGAITAIFYDKFYAYMMKQVSRLSKEQHQYENIFQQLAIDENSYSYGMWEETPIDMYMRVYYFDCVNAEDVMQDNAKPL